jgi:hypothetical protein
MEINMWNDLNTLSDTNPFQWQFNIQEDAIIINRPTIPNNDVFSISEIFYILHKLFDRFSNNEWIPLANSVTVHTKEGLGKTIYDISENTTHKQAASQLGPILMQYNLFDWNQQEHGIAFKIIIVNLPRTIGDLRNLFQE